MASPTQLTLSLGSNIDAKRNIRLALDALREKFGELALSPVYESEAVGFEGDNFLNLVVAATTDLDLTLVQEFLKHLEDDIPACLHFEGRLAKDDKVIHAHEQANAPVL